MPLAKILGVTTTELLSGKRLESTMQFTVDEVESLMSQTIVFSIQGLRLKNDGK